MTKFLVKKFIKNYDAIDNVAVRTSYGVLTGTVGIICNILLFAVKLIVGLILHSISVTADAFNNLSDAGASIISLVGVKLAGKPADKDHPFGHGRIEYVAALIVAFIVIQVGFSFFKSSFGKIMNPEDLSFQLFAVIILLLSISVKLWLGLFNRKLGKKIDSQVMMAVFTDSIGDVITTSVTIISIVVFHFFQLNIDGFVGIVVAVIVIWAGIGIAKDTLKPLIGEPADPQVYQDITDLVESYDGIVGSHDLIIHNYGPGRSMASIHAEVPNDVDVEISHEIIDRAERETAKKLGIFLVIHMDPIETKNDRINNVRSSVEEAVTQVDSSLSLHDFRLVEGKSQINLIFDLVVPNDYSAQKLEEIQMDIITAIRYLDKRYQCVITIDKSFVSTN